MKCIILLCIVFLTVFVFVACAPFPPTPLPTPTTVVGTELPVEKILRDVSGSICEDLETEYQVFFIRSAEKWQELQSRFQVLESLSADEAIILGAIDQTHGLLFVWRICKPSDGYSIAINRVVEVSDHQLAVYIELRDLAPGSGDAPVETGAYEIVRIPWSEENADNPTVEVVDYRLWSEMH